MTSRFRTRAQLPRRHPAHRRMGSALNFSSLAEDLASHGYVVVGLDIASTANPEHCAGRNDDEDCATRLMAPLVDGIGRAIDHLQRIATDARFKRKARPHDGLASSAILSAAHRPHSSARRTCAERPASISMAGRLAVSFRTAFVCPSCFCSPIMARLTTQSAGVS